MANEDSNHRKQDGEVLRRRTSVSFCSDVALVYPMYQVNQVVLRLPDVRAYFGASSRGA
ncbi:MAG: hypothetical protein ACR2GR_07705 [Rhodothermales bacterium]